MKKPIAKLSPLECELCRYRDNCQFGTISDELYRIGSGIRFESCALYNGGRLYRPDNTVTDISKLPATATTHG